MYKINTTVASCLVIIVLVIISCGVLFWWDCTSSQAVATFQYAPPTTAADCRSAINAYRKSKSIFLLAAATAEQQRCADESAKIDAKGYNGGKGNWFASGNKCKQATKYEFSTAGSTFEERMKQYAATKDTNLYYPYATSVACGTDGNGVYLINYHYDMAYKTKPPVLGKPLDELGDKPYDGDALMDAKSMMEFINYIRKAKKLKPLVEGTASQMRCAQKISDACSKNYETKGDGALNPKLYENCSAQAQFMTIAKANDGYHTMLNDDAKLKLVLNKDFKSIACGFTKKYYIFSFNFYT